MISAGVDGRLPYMTYPEPWRGPPKQPPVEFLRPAPKPLPTNNNNNINNNNNNNNRYNGMISTNPNGTRLGPPPQRPISKYHNQATIITPVNLTQHKEEAAAAAASIVDDLQQFNDYARLFPHNAHFPPFSPYPPAFFSTHYAHMMRQASFPQTPLSPLEAFSPTTPTATNNNSSTFLSPSFSPPSSIHKQNQITSLKDNKRTPPHTTPNIQPPPSSPNNHQSSTAIGGFKVPSGKEGSLKHRILTLRPEDLAAARNNNNNNNNNNNHSAGPLDLQLQKTIETPRKRLLATLSPPPRSPKKIVSNSVSHSIIPASFNAGSLIQLANGDLRRIEDMRTEDFINSAENNPELRLAESTIVRIEENKNTGNATITLSYNQRRTQVEVESSIEHPFFIYGQGWASCNPEKTLQNYKLKVNRLQVGDILVSLTPRETSANITMNNKITSGSNTMLTSSTTTSMISRQITATSTTIGGGGGNSINNISNNNNNNDQTQPLNLHSSNNGSLSPDNRKRRWSAPDQICENDLNNGRRHRGE